MKFEWDDQKNQINIEKHSADVTDAKFMFENDLLIIPDIRFDYSEPRFIGFGYVNGRLMNVVYTGRLPDIIRIISFSKVNNREKRNYETYKNRLG